MAVRAVSLFACQTNRWLAATPVWAYTARMGCHLILAAFCVAGLDLYLLIRIFMDYGLLAGLACVFLPSMLLGPVALNQRQRLMATAQEQPQALPTALSESLLLLCASGLLVYPGPISTCLGVLLLFSPMRRLVLRMALKKLEATIAAPGGPGAGQAAGPVFIRVVGGSVESRGPSPDPGPAFSRPAPGGLKSVEGRTLDEEDASDTDQPRLEGFGGKPDDSATGKPG